MESSASISNACPKYVPIKPMKVIALAGLVALSAFMGYLAYRSSSTLLYQVGFSVASGASGLAALFWGVFRRRVHHTLEGRKKELIQQLLELAKNGTELGLEENFSKKVQTLDDWRLHHPDAPISDAFKDHAFLLNLTLLDENDWDKVMSRITDRDLTHTFDAFKKIYQPENTPDLAPIFASAKQELLSHYNA